MPLFKLGQDILFQKPLHCKGFWLFFIESCMLFAFKYYMGWFKRE